MRKAAGFMIASGTMALVVTSCGEDCFGVGSCVPDVAVVVTVSASPGGGPVVDATVQVSGAISTTVRCGTYGNGIYANQTMCTVFGGAGVYVLEVSAPGYGRVQRTVKVGNKEGHCGCGTVATQFLSIALQRNP